MRKIFVKLSEKVYFMSCELNMSISDLIGESLNHIGLRNYSIGNVVRNSMFKDCFPKHSTTVSITEENEELLEYVSNMYYVSKEGFINSAVELYYTMQINTKGGENN